MHGQPPSGESPEQGRHREWAQQQAYGHQQLTWWQRVALWRLQRRRRRATRRPETRWQRFRRNSRESCDGCDGCDGSPGCDCNFPLLHLVRLSTVLAAAAAVTPDRPGTRVALAAIACYQRWLSRLTPACPSTPHCSAYAAEAVRLHGARRGLRAAAAQVAACSRDHRH